MEGCGKIFGTELRTILINLHHNSSKESGTLTDLKEALDFYSSTETCALGEFPSICGSYGQVPKPIADVLPIRPHHYPDASEHQKVVNVHEPVDKDVLIGDM